jgi:hypothetical protein
MNVVPCGEKGAKSLLGSLTSFKSEPMPSEFAVATSSAPEDDLDAQAEQSLQGYRFHQLSLHCHEQNWAQVHAIAEQILLDRRKAKEDAAANNWGGGVHEQGNRDTKIEVSSCVEGNRRKVDLNDAGGAIVADSQNYDSNADDKEIIVDRKCTRQVDTKIDCNRHQSPPVSKPRRTSHSGTPHVLSTCLGTASPLAWTCRYSAPSSTIKLVLDVDPLSVRRCLPQLGTPLHECVGRPRPLRKLPLERGVWFDRIGAENSSEGAPAPTRRRGKSSKKVKKKENQIHVPPILAGLREWRRTVRTLIRADELLMKEDTKVATAAQRNATAKEWQRAVHTIIKDNVAAMKKFKEIDMPGTVHDSANQEPAVPTTSKFSSGECHYSLRATLAQDADGNTPLHFIIRAAAAPANSWGGWQDHELDEDDDDFDETESKGDIEVGADGRGSNENDSAGEDDPETTVRANSQRHCGYWDTRSTPWDGIRWCMEAHLRRVERRTARQSKLQKNMNECNHDDIDGDRGASSCVASVQIASPMLDNYDHGDKAKLDSKNDDKKLATVSSSLMLPVKRKCSNFCDESVKSREKVTDQRKYKVMNSASGHSKRKAARAMKYFNEDEFQDCKYFCPLLGVVRDLVHSCPEAVGIPDHREYSETPLIVALKSSIYVVMEPDNEFELLERTSGPDTYFRQHPGVVGGGLGGRAGGDGFAVWGGGLFNSGTGGSQGPPGFSMRNQSFNIFQDDGVVMAVLRGHNHGETQNFTRTLPTGISTSASNLELSGDHNIMNGIDQWDEDCSYCSTTSDDSAFEGEDDPRYDAFADECVVPLELESPGVQPGSMPRRRPRYDYQTALEFRIFCLVRIMLESYPRAACLMISDYSPLHSAVFHGRCSDTIRLLLDAEARFRCNCHKPHSSQEIIRTSSTLEPCPTLSGPAMLCANTRGELPIHFACMRNECTRTIRLLAEADPRSALVRDASGKTPLRWLWIRFVDGLLDRFGGRDTQQENNCIDLAFQEQKGGHTSNSSSSGSNVIGTMSQGRNLSLNDAFDGGPSISMSANINSETMFVFNTDYLRRTRYVDRTVDYLRMRHVPSSYLALEYDAAEHAIAVLLKLKYLQQSRNRQIESYDTWSSGIYGLLPPEEPMSTKDEFILYAFEKFISLIHAGSIATEAEVRIAAMDNAPAKQSQTSDNIEQYSSKIPSRKRLWHSLNRAESNKQKQFLLVHEACRSAANPAAICIICIKLFSDQLLRKDDDGQLPLHKVACRGLGWEPLGSEISASDAFLADETLLLLREVLSESHKEAPMEADLNKQLPLHCAIDSLVTSLVMGKKRRASQHAEATVALQKHRRTLVEVAIQCLSELLQANALALQKRDGITGLFPFMQAATPHNNDYTIIKYASDLSRRPGFDVGVGYHSMESEVVEEDDVEAESDHVTIIYYLLREDPSAIQVFKAGLL